MKSLNVHSSLRETYLLKFRKCSTTETLDKVFERILDKLNDEGGDINKITSLNERRNTFFTSLVAFRKGTMEEKDYSFRFIIDGKEKPSFFVFVL